MSQVFISYANHDQEIALKFARDLAALNVTVWSDLEITAGALWEDVIREEIEHSDFVLLIVSPASAASPNVSYELGYALGIGKSVIPVLVEPIESDTIHFRLSRFQFVDATQPEKYHQALEQIIQLVQHKQPVRIGPEEAREQRTFVDKLAVEGR